MNPVLAAALMAAARKAGEHVGNAVGIRMATQILPCYQPNDPDEDEEEADDGDTGPDGDADLSRGSWLLHGTPTSVHAGLSRLHQGSKYAGRWALQRLAKLATK